MAGVGHTEALPDAPPILSNVPGSFAWGVLHQRHPQLVNQIRDAFPYPLDQDHALDRLGRESAAGAITPLGRRAPDRAMWDGWGRDYFGQRWIDVPFLWAESYFYRKLLDVIGFFDTGPWAGIDPFEPFKSAELNDASLVTELAALDRVLSLSADERASALVHASLWGNRADLGFRISASSEPSVSDATTADLIACLRRLRQAPGHVAEAGRRLWQALHTGRLAVRTHAFSCAPWPNHHMPADLAEQFGSAALTIMKGDLNYRRLVGDCYWPPTTPFASLTRYFPGPVAALRTLKSDVVVCLDEQVLTTLDSTGGQWRTNGTHALIQVRP